ncbi:Bug family tripartite tricarboxylate transporter substrate binding protein [Roseicella frigidaeris]|uniref:Tripartite tricarboxylate transporter substrate binding protein n=1 Tax=Roseicella frigidaeris TaxID=2230885 RepID=A0A327M327_9PROT|nr:tripartite tricarboxylate transporter substrate binding protein [Roseicella frigidaeris]RAI57310.1 tripartite tricarboxylate transporter substrate binding protein [Roseicella frigidaeris]
MRRRPLLLASLLLPSVARAQASRPVRLVLPFPAGGPTDALARLMAPSLADRLGQPVVVDNRPGGGGVPAAEHVMRAAPDGLTLLFTTNSTHSTGPALQAQLPYDPERDFTPIALLAKSPNLVLIAPGLQARSLAAFVAWAKAHPGGVNFGSSGIGTIPHLTGELFNLLTGAGMVHVPYRGTGGVYAEMRRGDVHALFDPPLTALPNVAAGSARALATTGAARTPLAPDLPTGEEAGVPGFVVETWFGLFGPAGLPDAAQRRWVAASEAVLAEADLRSRLLGLGAEAAWGGPATLTATAGRDRERWVRVVRDAGLHPND